MHKFELGEIAKDIVTGFQGVVMVRAEYFTDCTHYGLCPQELKDGKTIDWEWFDETRLVKVEGQKIEKQPRAEEAKKITSGPFPAGPQL